MKGAQVFLNRQMLNDLLAEVAEDLKEQKVVAHVYVVGGAAMALGYDSDRYTVDVDAIVLDGHTALTKAVHKVARRRGLLTSWFNENAAPFVSKTRDTEPLVVFDNPSLRVFAASPEHLLAMKIVASRGRDTGDIRTLCDLLNITTIPEAVDIVGRYFPGDVLSRRARMILSDLLAD